MHMCLNGGMSHVVVVPTGGRESCKEWWILLHKHASTNRELPCVSISLVHVNVLFGANLMPPHHLSSTWHALTNQELPHVSASLVHVNTSSSCMDATCHPASGATWLPHFPCFINTTKRDNFLIRSPFEVKRTPLESSRWALRSDASFAKIGVLQNFAFLDPPGWFLPTEKLLASKILY